ncbi:MAG: hypothetical protein OH363_05515 [Candidatus Parvarchaeota archaeon]|nr:hypothetical protein [Candidatus Jingweiarchaeum tengchongense]
MLDIHTPRTLLEESFATIISLQVEEILYGTVKVKLELTANGSQDAPLSMVM